MHTYKNLFLPLLLLSINASLLAQTITASKNDLVLSAIKGTISKPDTIFLNSNKNSKIGTMFIKGDQAGFFSIVSPEIKQLSTNTPETLILEFRPSETFIGIATASLTIKGTDIEINLIGLSTKGLEGENESPLSEIVEALGYKIDIGWTTLANNLNPDLQGEEFAPAMFKKAGDGNVEMIPVARYSPDFALNFGYYTSAKTGPVQHQVGILATAEQFPEHQTLFPAVDVGTTSFAPGIEAFGFYAISPSHTVYSDDIWNILYYPTHATHAMRIYPVKGKNGILLENTYLVCMEEAANGDYNDYVFLVKNVEPVWIQKEFQSLFNGKDLTGWYTWFEGIGKNKDPNNIFTVQEDGVLHDMGKDLGYMMTEKSFGNYHFVLEFKWGEKRWPPRDSLKRDSGICYNVPVDEPDYIWPASVECQIQEGDVGDFWLIGYSTIQVEGKQNSPYKYTRVTKKKDAEKPNREWNRVEVISFNGKCVHIVNGVVVNYGENASLIGGKILLQSEYAEVYYRNIALRNL